MHVIASEKNLGFARGNNLGIRYARSHFEPDFIVAANSDIIFEQEEQFYIQNIIAVDGGAYLIGSDSAVKINL